MQNRWGKSWIRTLRGFIAALLVAVVLPACASGGLPAPTAQEVQAALQKFYEGYYLSDNQKFIYHTSAVKVTVTDVKVGETYQKQVLSGALAQPTRPVKLKADLELSYTGGKVEHIAKGAGSDEVYFFYKDAFGDWTFKTGSM